MNTINWTLAIYSGLAGGAVGALSAIFALAQNRRMAEKEQDAPNFYKGLVRDSQ